MLQVSFLRDNKNLVLERLQVKNYNDLDSIDEIINKDDLRRKNQKKLDNLSHELNILSKKIGSLFQQGRVDEADDLKKESINIKKQIKDLQEEYSLLESAIKDLLINIPNIPHISVPSGFSDQDNELIKENGEIPVLSEHSKPHWDLCDKYNLVDFDLGNKVTGSGFPVYLGKGAKLQRALISYFLDMNINAGYLEYLPPHLVNESSGFGTGQLPKFEDDLYKVSLENSLYLIPTAEVPITNLFRSMIFKENELPIKCTAYSPCFRKEAGSYGKDVRGLNRLHQFDKVEIVEVDLPSSSYSTLDRMVAHVETILQGLDLPYRIVRLCGGDLSFSSSLTYDFEVYSAGQDKWLEVSSVSNFETYQSTRLKLRYKDSKGKNQFCHTLNGSALALPRIFASLIENNQTDMGIKIPESLVRYTGFDIIN